MSESDLADLRSFYEAVAIGNLPVALSALHPEVEVHPPESWPDSEFALRGHKGMSEYLRKLAELFEDYDMNPSATSTSAPGGCSCSCSCARAGAVRGHSARSIPGRPPMPGPCAVRAA